MQKALAPLPAPPVQFTAYIRHVVSQFFVQLRAETARHPGWEYPQHNQNFPCLAAAGLEGRGYMSTYSYALINVATSSPNPANQPYPLFEILSCFTSLEPTYPVNLTPAAWVQIHIAPREHPILRHNIVNKPAQVAKQEAVYALPA